MKILIPKDKIKRTYYAAIWFASIFVALLYKLPYLYAGYVGVEFDTPGQLVLNIFLDLVTYGLFPALMCFICSSFLNGVLWRRGIVLCSRNDFVYFGMLFTGASRLLIGFVNIFSIINFDVFSYTQAFADELVLTLCLYIMGIVLMKQYYGNSYKKIYKAYQAIAPIYFVFLGLSTLAPAISSLVVYTNPTVSHNVSEMLEIYLGASFTPNKHMFIASIIAICLFAVILLINMGVGMILKKKADKCANDDMGIIMDDEGPKGPDDSNPFDEFRNDGANDEKVFDEFDL